MYSSLFHFQDGCRGQIYINLSANTKIIGVPILNSTSVSIGQAEFVTSPSEQNIVYFCSECNVDIEPNATKNIGCMCSYCGEILCVDNLFRVKDGGGNTLAGFYCESCITKKTLAKEKKLSQIVYKINTKNGENF